MSVESSGLEHQSRTWRSWLPVRLVIRGWRSNVPLMMCGLVMTAGTLLLVLPLLLDQRLLINEPLWLKPIKFTISTAVYSFTFVWLLQFVEGHKRWKSTIAWATAVALFVEIAVIALQAWRLERSHFNLTTDVNAILYLIMGAFIVVAWLMNMGLAILLFRQSFTNPVFGWSLRLATVITIFGAGMGFAMVALPNESQAEQIEETGEWEYIGSHAVGVEDGGAGLPIVGWSAEAGDIRAAHFVGLHAIQVVPVLGWLLSQLPFAWLGTNDRVRLVWAMASGYAGVVLILAWQALRAQSVIAPDWLTLTGYAVVFLAAGFYSATTLASASKINRNISEDS